jgi:molybdenum cofactor biosynthesis enzyme MoaA
LGEPFLNKDFVELCRISKQNIKKVQTITNGMFIKWDAVKYIDRLTFSIDFLDKIKLETHRRGANFEVILENFKKAASLKKAAVNQVISACTSDSDMQEMQEFCKKYKCKLNQPRIQNWGIVPDNAVKKDREKHGDVKKACTDCNWGVKRLYFDALGRLHPCCIRMTDEYVVTSLKDFNKLNKCSINICKNCPD